MKKRVLSLILAVVMACALLPTAALAAEDFQITDGVLVKYNGPGDDVVIPSGVTSIGERAFSDCTGLTSVVIPDSVTDIGIYAFKSCTGLTSVTIPDGVTSIEEGAFSDCKSLTSVTIPGSVTSIGRGAFALCYGLTSVTIPDSVTSIGPAAFSSCHSLTDVYYGGTEAQWKAVEIGPSNDDLLHSATILHYNSTMPTVTPTAYASTQSVLVDGKAVEFQAYALKDANGNDTNYIKLRDVAQTLNGTAVEFNVGWDGAVNIEMGKAYVPNGSEMSTPFSGNRAYEPATAETRINGSPVALDAIVLKDDAGGAYTYYKLRDLGEALGFKVGWSAEKGIYIETN